MSKWDNLIVWLGCFSFLSVLFLPINEKFLFLISPKKNLIEDNFCYYISSHNLLETKDDSLSCVSDFSVLETVFLKSKTPPFLIKSKKLAFLEKDSLKKEEDENNSEIESEIESETDKEIKEYLVKKGDTFIKISKKFNISLETLLETNNLTPKSLLKPGQKLIILPISGLLHVVKKGENLSKIAKLYKSELKEIIEFNELENENDFLAGDLLIIPGGKKPALPSTFVSASIFDQIAQIPIPDSYFILPTKGRISQGLHGFFRNAVDISNNCGTPIVAAAGGRIQKVNYSSRGGLGITILHPNGVVTFYSHLSKAIVQPQQEVTTGEIIGYIGNTGRTRGRTGCHLHFEVRNAPNFLNSFPRGFYLE